MLVIWHDSSVESISPWCSVWTPDVSVRPYIPHLNIRSWAWPTVHTWHFSPTWFTDIIIVIQLSAQLGLPRLLLIYTLAYSKHHTQEILHSRLLVISHNVSLTESPFSIILSHLYWTKVHTYVCITAYMNHNMCCCARWLNTSFSIYISN